MTTAVLLKKLHQERRDAVNRQRYVPVRELPAAQLAAVLAYGQRRRAAERARMRLSRFGLDASTIQYGGRGQVRQIALPRKRQQALHAKLTAAHQAATLALLRATTGPQRAAAIDQFIEATKEITQ